MRCPNCNSLNVERQEYNPKLSSCKDCNHICDTNVFLLQSNKVKSEGIKYFETQQHITEREDQ